MKRKPEDVGPEGPSKRQLTSSTDLDYDDEIEIETGSVYSKPGSSDSSTVRPTQTAITPATDKSSNSRAGRKFPSDLKTIQCPHAGCPKTFNRPARLAAHLRSHNNDRPFACPYDGCDKDYIEEKHLKQHIKSSHTHERRYQCEVEGCGKSFVTATRLRRHGAVHEGQERYRCRGYEGCSKSFRKRATLDRHVRADHLGLSRFPCGNDGCSEGFDSAGALRNHVARVHAEIAFWCDDCEERDDETGEVVRKVGFTQLALLQAHVRRDHVSCVFCPDVKITNGQWGLTHHMDMYHSGKTVEDRKTVQCLWSGCTATFTRVSNLNIHIKTAHEGFSWVCGQVDLSSEEGLAYWNWEEEGCQDGFVSKAKLVDHVKHVHLGMKRPPTNFTAPPKQTVVDELAGHGQAKYKAYCTIPGCETKFIRHHELKLHLATDHIGEGTSDHVNREDERSDVLINHQYQAPVEPMQSDSWPFGSGELPVDPELEQGSDDFGQPNLWDDMQKLVDFTGLESGTYLDD